MSLKPVELQIALPRTHEAGKVQNSLQHRPALDQQQLAGLNVKHSQEIAMRSSEVDESAESALRDGGKGNSPEGHAQKHKPRKQDNAHDAEHPFKGHRIDLSL
ncbi:hypothetical protein [Paenibacillus sp. MMS20-IR301]|uniref:hypothetical protein n=1 Tax=Paenibacillus sp. MMS20-IR301 TaxID=2895946 RepID=UPI0028EFA7FA|nr:hypothetical protein [Paenibacillus sp. MMS20-IR301]WNS44815.1 hypothetical protein LOS79_05945 [Paenibacillus sp. MMS20-IR301]